MKYLPITELEMVTSALNFQTSDCRVVGGCDLYTTKAAGSDKKLYKSIEQSLESQHESLMRLSESLSPPNAEIFSATLNRASPFGHLGKVSSRRTFAYMIATLNASHPDYDFSHFLRPSDFRRETNLARVGATVDETLYNLRPRAAAASNAGYSGAPPVTPGGTPSWSPRMWKNIDKEMALEDCEIYRYAPEEDPFDEDESAIWSINYFFFNKERRRVLYIHFRGLSHSSNTMLRSSTGMKRTRTRSRTTARHLSFSKTGAGKRAGFWLGDKAKRCVSEPVWVDDEDDDMDDYVIGEPGDEDEMDADDSYETPVEDDEEEDASDDEEDEVVNSPQPSTVSEAIAEQIEI